MNVTTHRENYLKRHPVVNVKVYRLDLTPERVRHRFGCPLAVAEKAVEAAWEQHCEAFWGYAADDAVCEHLFPVFGGKLETFSEGRSGGWLVVRGLPDPEDWGERHVAAWQAFVEAIEKEIICLSDSEGLLDTIAEQGMCDAPPDDPLVVVPRYLEALDELTA